LWEVAPLDGRNIELRRSSNWKGSLTRSDADRKLHAAAFHARAAHVREIRNIRCLGPPGYHGSFRAEIPGGWSGGAFWAAMR
jgi:hypothetical protein